MSFVRKLRSEVRMNRKVGFASKLRECIERSRREEREVQDYMQCMDIYKQISDDPFKFTFDDIIMAEDALDAMIMSAVADQRKHREYAKEALKQMQA